MSIDATVKRARVLGLAMALLASSLAMARPAPLAPTDPHPALSDELWCGAYVGRPPRHADAHAVFEWSDRRLFGIDAESDAVDGHPYGFIDVGVDGRTVRLFAIDGATLALGGRFASDTTPRLTLDMTPPTIDRIDDHRGEEPSSFGAATRLHIAQAGHARDFDGYVQCSVYDFPSFVANSCDRAPVSKTAACAALRRSLASPSDPLTH